MIGRVTNVGMIDYTASYDGEKLYLYEQSKLVAEREMKDLTGVVFDGNVIYYTTSGNNTIFAETVLGHALKSYTLKEYEEAAVYKKLSDTEFVIAAANDDGVKVVIYNVTEGTVTLELPCDSFHDFVYDGEDGFRISGHRNVNISIYEDDCDYEDIEYSEYEIGSSGSPRKGEVDKVHYNFVSEQFFRDNIASYVEYNEYDNNLYGSNGKRIADALDGGKADVVICLDINGAKALKKHYGEQVRVIYVHRDIEKIYTAIDERVANGEITAESAVHRKEQVLRDIESRNDPAIDIEVDNNGTLESSINQLKEIMGL